MGRSGHEVGDNGDDCGDDFWSPGDHEGGDGKDYDLIINGARR